MPPAAAVPEPGLDPRLLALALAGGGLVTPRAAAQLGVPRAVLRWAVTAGRLIRVGHGAYAPAGAWTSADARTRHLLRLRAALLRTPGGVAVAGSAAVLLGLPLPQVPEQVRILVPHRSVGPADDAAGSPRAVGGTGGNGSGAPGVHRSRAWTDADEVIVWGGMRVTDAARTVVDCARYLDRPWALAVADAARRTLGLSAVRLRAAADRRPQATGHAAAVWVARHAVRSAESALESLARAVIIDGGFPAPTPQVWLRTARGEYRVDLLDPGGRVVTEADGRLKYATPADLWQEKRREDDLRDEGLQVVRFTYADYRRPRPWLARYGRALARAADDGRAVTEPPKWS